MALSSMDSTQFIEQFRIGIDYDGQLSHIKKISSREPQFSSLRNLNPVIADALRKIIVEQLVTHQADAVSCLRKGNDSYLYG